MSLHIESTIYKHSFDIIRELGGFTVIVTRPNGTAGSYVSLSAADVLSYFEAWNLSKDVEWRRPASHAYVPQIGPPHVERR